MKISKKDVIHVADLARLEFSESEIEKFTDQLENILGYIEKLSELDTTGVEPTSHVLDVSTPLREDKAIEWITPEEALQNAPEREENFFTVPKVIDD